MPLAVVQIRTQPTYRRQAFEQGLKRLGYTIEDYRCGRRWPSSRDDLLVVWNLHRGPDEAYAQQWEARGGTVVVAENGYLQKVDKTFYALSVHGHNGSGWFPVGRDQLRFQRLGIELKPMRSCESDSRDARILVRDQRSIGSQLMHSPRGWGQSVVAKLRAKGFKHVTLMHHPGDKGKLEADLAALAKADRVITWASAIGVRALVEGLPVEHAAPKWICGGWKVMGREHALEHMAWGQWHHEEIATGEPFERFRAAGWDPWTDDDVKATIPRATT